MGRDIRQHLEPGHPNNPKPFAICGAPTRQETSAPFCTQRAGYKTNHPGYGRCGIPGHGGDYKEGGPSYLEYLTYLIRKKGAVVRGPLDLMPELEAMRRLYSRALDELFDPLQLGAEDTDEDTDARNLSSGHATSGGSMGGMDNMGGKVSSEHIPFARILDDPTRLEIVDKLGGRVMQMSKTIGELQAKFITLSHDYQWLLAVFTEALKLHVKDRETRERIIDHMESKLPGGLTGGNIGGGKIKLEKADFLPAEGKP